jgi:hypothetical protein
MSRDKTIAISIDIQMRTTLALHLGFEKSCLKYMSQHLIDYNLPEVVGIEEKG